MFEINPIYFILLAEGFGLMLILLLVLALLAARNKSRRIKAVRQLISQVRKHSSVRNEETGSFLQAIYQLEDEALLAAIAEIDKQEKKFFQQLAHIFFTNDYARITTLDALLAELIDTYKCLKPRQAELQEDTQMILEIENLRAENKKLQEEVSITKNAMNNMMLEFGNMFGGGKDHELALHEVKEKVVEKVDEKVDEIISESDIEQIKAEVQK